MIITALKGFCIKLKLRWIKRKNLKQMQLNRKEAALNNSTDRGIELHKSHQLVGRYAENRENQIDEVAEELEDAADSQRTDRHLNRRTGRRQKFTPVP